MPCAWAPMTPSLAQGEFLRAWNPPGFEFMGLNYTPTSLHSTPPPQTHAHTHATTPHPHPHHPPPMLSGWSNSCPVFLVPCTHATATWSEWGDGSGVVESVAHPGTCLNRDCNSCGGGTVVKILQCGGGNASPFPFSHGQVGVGGCEGMCLSDGGEPGNPPCKQGEQTAQGQLTLQTCSQESTQGWVRTVV
jgi:hypothetical protein